MLNIHRRLMPSHKSPSNCRYLESLLCIQKLMQELLDYWGRSDSLLRTLSLHAYIYDASSRIMHLQTNAPIYLEDWLLHWHTTPSQTQLDDQITRLNAVLQKMHTGSVAEPADTLE